jgi:DNA-binding response OmpR family regulator
MKWILLADDEVAISAELKQTAQGFGLDVEVAHSTQETMRWIRSAQFDLILVEFNIRSERAKAPRAGNGVALVRQLRKAQVSVPILMFTAMEGEFYRQASLDAGADDFILKTSPITDLVARLPVGESFASMLRDPVGLNRPINSER